MNRIPCAVEILRTFSLWSSPLTILSMSEYMMPTAQKVMISIIKAEPMPTIVNKNNGNFILVKKPLMENEPIIKPPKILI
jgi:hypothetical protein